MKRLMTIIIDDEEPKLYEIFCCFNYIFTRKSYVVFTDNSRDKDGKLLFYAGKYEKIDDDTLKVNIKLGDAELKIVNEVINTLIEGAVKRIQEAQ